MHLNKNAKVEVCGSLPHSAFGCEIYQLLHGGLRNSRCEVSETEVIHYVNEAQGYMVEGRWSDVVSLLLTMADLILQTQLKNILSVFFYCDIENCNQ